MNECSGCPLRGQNKVCGSGDRSAKIMIVGEAPGREEELKGKPFVGKAGRELDALLVRSGLKREEVYITNIVRCRPPNNRRPTKKEVENCLPRLMEEISSIKPRVIALLGSTATSAFLNKAKVSELHGTFVGHFFVSYHPSMAFYGKREEMAEDFRKLSMVDRALKAEKRLVLLDYDGTLVPITRNPQDAVMKEDSRRVLKELSDEVVIVTGRSLRSIRNVFDLDVPIVANHGYEFYRVKKPEGFERFEKYRETAERLYEYFRGMKTEGALVENKTFGVALHYRNADESEFFRELEGLLKRADIDNMRVEYGKKVVELRPDEDWDKGEVVQYLQSIFEGLPIYIGDDNSDELAFEVIGEKGITIAVGKRETKARYMFRDEKEVLSFLSILAGGEGK